MLERRPWVPAHCEDLVQNVAGQTAKLDGSAIFDEIARLVAENRRIHDLHGINLNPASNVMNPRAEAMMASGLGSRASLGYPGDKYEMGLEAIERRATEPTSLAVELPIFTGHPRVRSLDNVQRILDHLGATSDC